MTISTRETTGRISAWGRLTSHDVVNIADLRRLAKRRLPRVVFKQGARYRFDTIRVGGGRIVS